MTSYLYIDDIENLALGSSFLGSGGGGNPYIGALLLKTAMKRFSIDRIELIDPTNLKDDKRVICSSGMGSPTIGSEKIPNGTEYAYAVKKLESILNEKFDYLSPIEIGGINSIVPFIAALYLNIPVLDGDGEGRAFPELQMTTFNLYQIKSTPMVLVDERGNDIVVNSIDNNWAEKVARVVTSKFGGRGYVANYPMNGKDYKKAAIFNSVTHAVELGKMLDTFNNTEDVEEILAYRTLAKKLFEGKLVDLVRDNSGGFSIGYAIFKSEINGISILSRVRFQNEYLFYDKNINGKFIETITTPQIISIVDAESYKPITTDKLRYGIMCKIFTIPIDGKWDKNSATELVGKEAFKLLSNFNFIK